MRRGYSHPIYRPGVPPPPECSASQTVTYGTRGLKLLTAAEYQASLEDLLGVTTDYAARVVNDSYLGKFPNNSKPKSATATPINTWTTPRDRQLGRCEQQSHLAVPIPAVARKSLSVNFYSRPLDGPLIALSRLPTPRCSPPMALRAA